MCLSEIFSMLGSKGSRTYTKGHTCKKKKAPSWMNTMSCSKVIGKQRHVTNLECYRLYEMSLKFFCFPFRSRNVNVCRVSDSRACNIWLPMWEAWITVLSCRLRNSSQKGRNRPRKSKNVSRKHFGFPQTHTQTHTWLSGLAALCCHLVSETSRWNDGKGWKVESMCVPRQRTEEDRLVLRYYLYKCNVIASAIH